MNKDNFIKTTAYDVLSELSDEDVVYIADNADNLDELIASLHFSLGLTIRNDYIHGKDLCFDDIDEIEPDDLSSEVIKYIVYLIKSKDIYEKADKNNLSLSSEDLDSYNAYESYLIAKDKKIKDKALSLYKEAMAFCEFIQNELPIDSEYANGLYENLTMINSKICSLPDVDKFLDYVLDYDDYVPDITIESGDNYYFCIQPFNSQVKEGKLSKDLYEIYAALIEFIYAFDAGQYNVAIANIKEDYKDLRKILLKVLYVLCNMSK